MNTVKLIGAAFMVTGILLAVLLAAKKFNQLELDRTFATNSVGPTVFRWVEGRPWMLVQVGEKASLMLFDTGATYSIVDKDLLKYQDVIMRDVNVQSAAGQYVSKRTVLNFIRVGDKQFDNISVLSSRGHTSILGASLIFQFDPLLISKEGFIHGQAAKEKTKVFARCVDIEVEYIGPGEISAVYFMLDIQKRIQPVLFDTGQREFLIGTSRSEKSIDSDQSSARYALLSTADGKVGWQKYYWRNVRTVIGRTEQSHRFRFFPNITHIHSGYVIGIPILDKYDIYIDLIKKKSCFIEHPKINHR